MIRRESTEKERERPTGRFCSPENRAVTLTPPRRLLARQRILEPVTLTPPMADIYPTYPSLSHCQR